MRKGDYPTPAQVSMYLEEVWLDDAYRVEFRKQNPKTPLYGFDEKYFSNVAEGQVIVTGNLIINYRYPGYLWTVIADRMRRLNPEMGAYTAFAADVLRATPSQRIEMIRQARQAGYLEMTTSVMTRLIGNKSWGTTVEAPDLVNSLLKDSRGHYSPINIKIYFDKPNLAWYHSNIIDVHFTGSSMTISASGSYGGDSSASGQPIFEVYSFFAKDIKPVFQREPARSAIGRDSSEVGNPEGDHITESYEKVSDRWT